MPQVGIACAVGFILHYQQNDEVAYCQPIPPPACENLPPVAFTQLWVSLLRYPFSFCEKKQKADGRKDGENEWRFSTWKQK